MATLFTLAPNVKRQLFDDDGLVLNGGSITTKIAGTATNAPTYQTASGTLHANPIVLDASGRVPGSGEIFMAAGAVQDWTLKDSAGNTIWTLPGISAVPSSSVNVDILVTAGEALTAGDLAYISDGSGGKTPGKAYKADNAQAYSSTTPIVGFIVNDIASGSQGIMRTDGQITLAGPLTPGSTYYVGTAGAITVTPSAFARVVGVADTTTDLIISANPASAAAGGLDIFQVRVFA